MEAKKLKLVLLAGGRSVRMGQDKTYLKLNALGDLDFFENALSMLMDLKEKYEKPCFDISKNFLIPPFNSLDISLAISCREEQKESMEKRCANYFIKRKIQNGILHEEKFFDTSKCLDLELCSIIVDKGIGVCEAIIACLVKSMCDCLFIPCDVPFMRIEILQKLIDTWFISQNNVNFGSANFVFEAAEIKEYTPHKYNKKRLQESLIGIYTQNALPFLKECAQQNNSLQNAIPAQFSKKLIYTKKETCFFKNINKQDDLQ